MERRITGGLRWERRHVQRCCGRSVGDWKIEEIELDDPKPGDVLVKMAYAGMCHSDEHATTGDLPLPLPVIGGHEGSGVVEAVGDGVTSVAVGDHVSMSFIPSCGRCK